jgi:tetratricopeptide (TPR) repeat protein
MDEALKSIRSFISRNPGKTSGWEELGWRHLELGQPDSAEAAFKQVLRIDSGNLWAQRGIVACHYQRGDLAKSQESLEQILSRNDLMPITRVQILSSIRFYTGSLSWILAERGRFNKALEIFEDARQLITDPQNEIRLERERSYLLRRINRADEVLQYARALEEEAQGRYVPQAALELMAIAYAAMDSLQAAQKAVNNLYARRWGNFPLYLQTMINAEVALAEKDTEKAFSSLEKLRTLGAHYIGGLRSIEYWEKLAQAHRLSGDLQKAVEAHKEILRVNGGHALSHYELGKLYEEMNRPTDAKREYEIFLEMWKDADEGLPQPEDARKRLTALTSS